MLSQAMNIYINGSSVASDELHHSYQHPQYHIDISSSIASSVGANNYNINHQKVHNNSSSGEEEDEDMGMMLDLRRGPWTVEEDHTLMSYISKHGEGRWNSLAISAGLKRTGKSCRLRWLNYLRPDVRRGNITLEEQLLILELHSRWGNRWSKIAQHLPGRTDNEIKNYWRTRVQKHAKQLKCDVNSKQFKDTMRYIWIPRLVERIQAASTSGPCSSQPLITHPIFDNHMIIPSATTTFPSNIYSEKSRTTATESFDSFDTQVSPVSDLTEIYRVPGSYNNSQGCNGQIGCMDLLGSQAGYYQPRGENFQTLEQNTNTNTTITNNNNLSPWTVEGGDLHENMWNVDDDWLFLQQQYSNNYLI